MLIQLGGKGCDIPILFFTWNRTHFHLVWPKSGSLNKPTTKDTKYRSCFITCMSQALYPLYRIRMGPKEFSSYPQNKRDKKPYPWGTTPYILFIQHDFQTITSAENNRARMIVSHHGRLSSYQSHAPSL